MAQRERGSETMPCQTCERPLALQANGDGSVSPVRCDHCYPQDIVEAAAEAASLPPEMAREVGTALTDTEEGEEHE